MVRRNNDLCNNSFYNRWYNRHGIKEEIECPSLEHCGKKEAYVCRQMTEVLD